MTRVRRSVARLVQSPYSQPYGLGWGRRSCRATDGKGGGFYLTGEYVELVPFSRIVHVERMHMPDVTPDNHVETSFAPDGSGTLMTMRMTLPDETTRTMMLSTGMEHGMEASYARLDSMN